ncbi:PAS domain containing protein [Nitzschia inconspicua]|uniref:Guanylate cyclase n=1 Tax=Nitzschia inconspicua TaxID=303405 RepID=A0A9K3K924_9STRA|nr:PAS domain containing protein [Nitzschia inconspicua]KAG7371579.1 PAS domain containing protein [Nitzschia inconspicua]
MITYTIFVQFILFFFVTCPTSQISAQQGNDDDETSVASYVLEPFEEDVVNDVVLLEDPSTKPSKILETNDSMFGKLALQVDYEPQNTNSILLEGTSLPELQFSLVDMASFCQDDDQLQQQQKQQQDPSTNGGCQHMETWQYQNSIPLLNSTEWHQVRIPTTAVSDWQRVQGSNNDKLDLDRINGWRMMLVFPDQAINSQRGTFRIDQLSFDGGPDLMGAFLHTQSYTEAIHDQTIQRIIHDSYLSENKTKEWLNVNNDGTMAIQYLVEQRESWGGYLSYQHIPPSRAYYNLSRAAAVSLDYTVVTPLSESGRGHFRLILFDGSDCVGDCTYNAEQLENYYSFHYILENRPNETGTIVVELQGDGNNLSPFWKTGWAGVEGNKLLDKDKIRGVKFEIVIDSQGDKGSFMNGSLELRNLQALEQYNGTEQDLSQCMIEPNLRLVISPEYFRRIEFLNLHRCCETCHANPYCNFALSDGKDCFLSEWMPSDHVRLVHSDFGESSFTVFWKDTIEARGEVCDVCSCNMASRTIDCRGRNLILPPTTIGVELWGPKVLDLRDNPRLLILGSRSLVGFESVEELLLPANLTYLSPEVLEFMPNLEKVSNENTDGLAEIANVITTREQSYGDICCSIGSTDKIQVGESGRDWSFCKLDIDRPGIDAVYENFTQYLSTETLHAISRSSPLFSEAAESATKCAEYCSILDNCRYFAYDGRLPNAFPICYHFNFVTQVEEVCCHPEHYRDENMTIPGWISGRVHRTRCEIDDARVHVTYEENLVLSEDNGFSAKYFVHLGSQPIRGAVWIEPKVLSNVDVEIYTIPSRVVLYDNETVATVTVNAVAGSVGLVKGFSFTVTNEVTACDSAFATANACVSPDNLAVYVDVVAPSKTSGSILAGTLAAVLTIIFISAAVYLYSDHKRRHSDLLLQINTNELKFNNPPQILGRGTFGEVFLAEYRGTHVAVKRVIPPRNNFEASEGRSKSSSRNQSDIEIGIDSDLSSLEMGKSYIETGTRAGFRTVGRRNWNGTFQFARDEYFALKTQFIEEMRHLSKLRHPCITTVMGAVINRVDEPSLVMEWMEHGSLWDLLHNETILIEGEQLLPILRDITSGLRFLHAATPQVIHGDLKAQNILVDSHFRAKVADFGLTQKQRVGAAGTPYWTAPEVLLGRTNCTSESDVYSFGIILYEIYSRKNPYEGEPFEKVLKEVCDPAINKRPPIPESCPTEIQSVMLDCLETTPSKRPTFEELDLRVKTMDVDMVQPGETLFSMQPRKQVQQREDVSLLDEVFPPHIAKALREGRRVEPESKDMVTIFFSDIVGYTSISETLQPIQIANMLDRLYLKFDALSQVHDVFKIETIGDCWMGATNLICDQSTDHVKRIADFALDAVAAANSTLIDADDPSRGYVSIRVGFHSGPVVADVVGSRNPRYCLFGDTVNVSSRMESHSQADCVHCSAVSARLLQQQDPAALLIARGRINIKGKDPMHTFWVKKKKKIDTVPRLPSRGHSRRPSTGTTASTQDED